MQEQDLSIALNAVRRACRLCADVQQRLITDDTRAKKDRSPVTIADYGAQAVVHTTLEEHGLTDPITSEEDASALRSEEGAGMRATVVQEVQRILPDLTEPAILDAIDRGGHPGGPDGRFWTLDPIDGTKGFIRGEQYAVALALIEDGLVQLGVLGCPNLPPQGTALAETPEGGTILYAVRGQGSHQMELGRDRSEPVQISNLTLSDEIRFCESVESAHSSHSDTDRLIQILGASSRPVRIDSQCKYAVVARGEADGYLRLPTSPTYREKIWDHAAGAIIVEEAGGRVTDVRGLPLNFSRGIRLEDNQGIVATNGFIHDPIIDALEQIL